MYEAANYYNYKRISTKEERGKQHFTRQTAALDRYAKEQGIEYLLEFQEDISGKDFTHRKEWNKLERLLQPGDTVVFKDISRFTREAENGYKKYMELLEKGVELIFLDNQTVSTPYIKQLMDVARKQDLIARTSLEATIKLLIIVELDRVERERLTISKRTRDGIAASDKTSGRKPGSVDKLTPELQQDIRKFLEDRTVKAVDIMREHDISRNTFKKYCELVKGNI